MHFLGTGPEMHGRQPLDMGPQADVLEPVTSMLDKPYTQHSNFRLHECSVWIPGEAAVLSWLDGGPAAICGSRGTGALHPQRPAACRTGLGMALHQPPQFSHDLPGPKGSDRAAPTEEGVSQGGEWGRRPPRAPLHRAVPLCFRAGHARGEAGTGGAGYFRDRARAQNPSPPSHAGLRPRARPPRSGGSPWRLARSRPHAPSPTTSPVRRTWACLRRRTGIPGRRCRTRRACPRCGRPAAWPPPLCSAPARSSAPASPPTRSTPRCTT